MEQLLELGQRAVNIVVNRDKQLVVGKNMNAVAEFVGVPRPGHIPLPPEELYEKWGKILRATQRNIRQMPNDQMNRNVTDLLKRQTGDLTRHIFGIGEQFIRCAVNGCDDLDVPITPPEDGVPIGEEIVRYGDQVIARLEQWWNTLDGNAWQQRFQIIHYEGISLHQLLDRCTWHSAHHARQIVDVLERLGIEPDGRLSEELLAGLPLPKQVWS